MRLGISISCTLIFSVLNIGFIFAQTTSLFQVTPANSQAQIIESVKALAGPTVQIIESSIQVRANNLEAVGTFNDALGLLDIKKGLIMTCGKASLIVGPNNASGEGYPKNISTTDEDFDSDLASVVPGEQFYDLVVIEFDIHVTNTVLSFNYIFGSEEYPEYQRQYNDVFGFFITGPGIPAGKNLAVTASGIPVSVKSINSETNTQFYVSNGDGNNPAKDFYLQYDGFTKKLVAKTEVIPCETYHIKLAISDAKDNILDSGVLIEEGSFASTSKLDIDVEFEHPEYPYAVESCNKGYFVVKKNPEWIQANESVTLDYVLSGTAAFGPDADDDYESSTVSSTTGTITIPANQESTKIEINAKQDFVTEDPETVILTLTLICDGNVIATAEKSMLIKDEIDFEIDSKVCKDVQMPINTDADPRYTFTWMPDPDLIFEGSCTAPNCTSPSVKLLADKTFQFHVKDNTSGCETDGNAKVTVNAVDAYFEYFKNENYTSADSFFDNLSVGAETYDWDFGDGGKSTVFEPVHTYRAGESLEPVTYKITLKVSALNGLCLDEHDTTIVIDPFYIPNVITPNNDPHNQDFVVKGIDDEKWDMKIYNRWGALVYHSPRYKNDWEGENVSGGVYYFKLSNKPADRIFKGWLHVIK